MESWKKETLDKLCLHIQSGGTPKSDKLEYYDGDISFVTIEDMTASNKYLFNTKKKITNEGLHNSSAWLVPRNSIMYSIYATLGLPLISKIEAATNQAILNLISIPDKIDNEYLYYYLLSLKNQIHKFSAQTTQSNLNAKIVKGFEIKYPKDLPEQTLIAEILSTADEAIEQTEKLIAKYQRIKTGLMQDLLTRGIDEHGNIRSKATHKFVVKKGIEVPEEWEVDYLGNCSELHNNLRRPISSLERFKIKGVYPYYGATGIIDYINEFRIQGKYVLIGEDGNHFLKFNKQNMAHLVEGKLNVSNHAHILSGKEMCSTEWIHYFFCNRDITYFLTRQGAGRFKLNKASLQKLPICLPIPTEQERIISAIKVFDQNFMNELKYLNKLNVLKTGLMQDLLSGKVRVS
jgi:type I restriction enzyme S subunit